MALFPETRWQVLADATLDGDTAGRGALASLCEQYRAPILAYVLSRGYSPAEAEDIVQDFFLEMVSGRVWRRADKDRGRFRHFLLGCLNRMLQSRARELARLKRGAGQITSLEVVPEGEQLAEEGADRASAEEFDRQWARFVVQQSIAIVEKRFAASGHARLFAVLRRFLPGASGEYTVNQGAKELGLTVGTMETYLHRLRGEFRAALRGRIAPTVSAPHEVEEEVRYLSKLLSSAVLQKIK
ncbi:MAG: sigma-70 family RNA polymerase sigma factor [Verrucomicrobiaceae bacterium]|nr:sigma-70 family RNA polymerase sigma factor [Verrucomicrobiaceae bacterium]